MFSRPLAFLLLALGCVTAAAGGAYVATRHNATESVVAPAAAPAAASPAPAAPAASAQPVAETEAPVSGAKADSAAAQRAMRAEKEPAFPPKHSDPAPQKDTPTPKPATTGGGRNEPIVARTVPMNGAGGAAGQSQVEPQAPVVQAAPPVPEPAKPAEPQPEPPRVPQFEEVIVPASSVIGLQLETSLSSERARLEDRVDARVSRDVMAAGRVAIPAGARVVGSVIAVDKGGKVKAPARIGIRFHTLILADGSEVALRTEPIYREGESPSGTSAKKIGGAAVAGAILGGILGGGKGAATGSAIGAAGGTAAVVSGDRTMVNIPSGSFVNAQLSSPATITVERRE